MSDFVCERCKLMTPDEQNSGRCFLNAAFQACYVCVACADAMDQERKAAAHPVSETGCAAPEAPAGLRYANSADVFIPQPTGQVVSITPEIAGMILQQMEAERKAVREGKSQAQTAE